MAELYYLPQLSFARPPDPILKAQKCYEDAGHGLPNTNFLKGGKWSPEGACLLSASEDNKLRVYDMPEDVMERAAMPCGAERDLLGPHPDNLEAAIQVREPETIYDYTWFTAMHTEDPVSCCFASTSRGQPVHLWDACTGELRCTYRAYDLVDEITPAYSLAFSRDGSKIYGGFNKAFRVWDTSRPGRDYKEVDTYKKHSDSLSGIVSCIAFNVDNSGLAAMGSYTGDVALYDDHTSSPQSLLQGQKGGLTQVQFSPDGKFLFCGARTCSEIWCWDIRFTSGLVYKLERNTGTTNQRISFDIEPCGRHLASGGQDGMVKVYDLSLGSQVAEFQAADDTVNGFQFHPKLPLAMATSGQRRYGDDVLTAESSDEDEEDDDSSQEGQTAGGLTKRGTQVTNALLVWKIDHQWQTFQEHSTDAMAEADRADNAEIDK